MNENRMAGMKVRTKEAERYPSLEFTDTCSELPDIEKKNSNSPYVLRFCFRRF